MGKYCSKQEKIAPGGAQALSGSGPWGHIRNRGVGRLRRPTPRFLSLPAVQGPVRPTRNADVLSRQASPFCPNLRYSWDGYDIERTRPRLASDRLRLV